MKYKHFIIILLYPLKKAQVLKNIHTSEMRAITIFKIENESYLIFMSFIEIFRNDEREDFSLMLVVIHL